MKKRILVVDIGGTHVKLQISRSERRKFDSGTKLSPRQLVSQIKKTAQGWNYDAISIGFPSVVRKGRIVKEPKHLATGWIGWDFNKSLGKPTRVLNDGLCSALVWNGSLLPLELGDLPYEGGIIEGVLGKPGLDRLGKKKWKREVLFCLKYLKLSFIADYIVLGGGNAKQFDTLPDGIVAGDNRNVYLGGLRMWETDPRTRRSKWAVL